MRCVVRQLVQGPPVETPIQVRLTGDDLDVLRGLADQVEGKLRSVGGYRVHDNLEQRAPCLELDIGRTAQHARRQQLRIGQVMRAAFTGLHATDVRDGDYLIPVLLQLRIDERLSAEQMANLYVESVTRQGLPLSSIATLKVKPQYMLINRYNQKHTVMVNAYAPQGELADTVFQRAKPVLDAMPLPPGYRLEYSGEYKKLGDSQSQMITAMSISMAPIAVALVLQFSSVMKAGVVLLAVPLGLIGAVVGLVATHSPLGFMSLLAVVSLAGVIVSHIIVLSDYIEEARAQGMELTEALIHAGLVRAAAGAGDGAGDGGGALAAVCLRRRVVGAVVCRAHLRAAVRHAADAGDFAGAVLPVCAEAEMD